MTEVNITVNEPFELKHSKRFYLRFLFHIVACFLFIFVQIYGGYLIIQLMNTVVTDENLNNMKYFAPCYLTNWNFFFQTLFLTMSLVYDVMEWVDRHDSNIGKKLKFARDVLFSGLVVPLSLFICAMFWTIFWIDRELVFPEVYDQLVPWWFNHCVHTNIVIVVLIETILQARRHPAHYKLELWMNGIAGVLYAVVYYSVYFFAGRWLYAVFGIMTWWQVCLYQLLIWTSTFVFYYLQFPINRIFHREVLTGENNTTLETKNRKQNEFHNKAYDTESDLNRDNLKYRSKNLIESSRF